MFNHVMIGTNDIERSKRFYDAVLGTLGAGEPVRNTAGSGHTRLFYRHDGSTFCVSEPINGEQATFANGGTIPGLTMDDHCCIQNAAHFGGNFVDETGGENIRLGISTLATQEYPAQPDSRVEREILATPDSTSQQVSVQGFRTARC